jgi:transposase-like protein
MDSVNMRAYAVDIRPNSSQFFRIYCLSLGRDPKKPLYSNNNERYRCTDCVLR